MAYKPVQNKSTLDIKVGGVGKSYEGTFAGHKTIQTPLGQQVIWQFMDEEDKPFGIWGFTNLNFQMENVPPNTLTRVTYLGQSKVKNKYGKFPHQAKVEVDDESKTDEANDAIGDF